MGYSILMVLASLLLEHFITFMDSLMEDSFPIRHCSSHLSERTHCPPGGDKDSSGWRVWGFICWPHYVCLNEWDVMEGRVGLTLWKYILHVSFLLQQVWAFGSYCFCRPTLPSICLFCYMLKSHVSCWQLYLTWKAQNNCII